MSVDGIWADMARLPERGPVTPDTFRAELLPAAKPVVLRGQATDWPLVEIARTGPDTLAATLRQHATETRLNLFIGQPAMQGRFGYTSDISGFNFETRQASLNRLLDNLAAFRDQPSPPHVYAGAIHLPDHLPGLLETGLVPRWPTPSPPLISLWLGNASTTAAHWDLTQNIACVINGTRRFTLLPIQQVANLYIGPIDRTLAGQPTSLVDFEAPDFDRFPRFRDALPYAAFADLEPGDAIYIPSLWVHQVMNRDPFGAMVNTWWREGPPGMETPYRTLLHAITTLRHMPEAERDQWKPLFELFIFGSDPSALAHLSEAARGVLGSDPADAIARARDMLGLKS